jgi:hypothetical protein
MAEEDKNVKILCAMPFKQQNHGFGFENNSFRKSVIN